MIKRISVCILCMIMVFSICVNAESIQSGQGTDTIAEQQTMPQNGERPAGGRGGRGGMQPPNGERPPMPANGEMPQRPEGEAPVEFNGERPQPPTDMTMQQPANETVNESGSQEETPKTNESSETTAEKESEMPQGGMGDRGGFGGMMQQGQNAPETESTPMTFAHLLKEYQTPIISVILLALAFVFVIFYKRKKF